MIFNVNYNPNTIKETTVVSIEVPNTEEMFPVLQLDTDSYIVQGEVQSGINFNFSEGVHCLQIGKYTSIADKVTFLINLNHNYKSVIQGSPSFFTESVNITIRRKGTILIQNDVWIGHGVTILSGVTINNGAVVGAESVVTKDVPAYAIVAGNPAKIVGYRFSEDIIKDLNLIRWWDWNQSLLSERQSDFNLPVSCFVEKYRSNAEEEWRWVIPAIDKDDRKNILFIIDFEEPFSVWEKVLKEYFTTLPELTRLILYLSPSAVEEDYTAVIMNFLQDYEDKEAEIALQEGVPEDDVRCLFAAADYFITTRQQENLFWAECADHYHVKLLYGTDIPVFLL